jgi:phage terminase large subunit-like protein
MVDAQQQPSPRLRAIAAYRNAIHGAVEKGPGFVDRIKRRLAQIDLFFLLAYVLGRKDVNHDWVFARCREVQAAPNGYLDLWAREHFKSSIITFGLTIQDILNDPEITVGIFSYSRPIAKAFLRQIKREFEGNEMLRGLFPDICWENPHRDAPKWSEDDGIIVKRKGNPKESTVEAWGLVDAQPTSKHFRLMVYDDVVTKESVTNPEMIAKVTTAWETSRNLTAEGGATRYIGTRWHHADTYREILARGAAIERRHPATIDGTGEGEPVLFTRERIAEKRRDMGPYTFGSQLLLDPTFDRGQAFLDEWLRNYEAGGDYSRMNKYLLVDPANSKKKTSDYTAMAVIGLGEDENYYLLDAVRDRLSLTERGDKLFALHKKWRPTRVGYERYGVQADVEYFKERMREQNYRFEIVELGGPLAKNDRIRRLIPIFEAGRFYLPYVLNRINYEGERVDLVKAFVEEEYRAFPVAQHDDLFDVISRIADPEMQVAWPRPGRREPEDRYAARRWRRQRGYSWMVA